MVVGIRSNFKIGSEKTLPFRYLGLEFREKQGITVDQTNILKKFSKSVFLEREDCYLKMRTKIPCVLHWANFSAYRHKLSQVLSFCTRTMASKIRTFKKSDLAVLNKPIRKCKAMPAKLCF